MHDTLDTDSQGLKLLPDDAFRHVSAEGFYQQTYTTVHWKRVSSLLKSRDRRALTVTLKPSVDPGAIINFLPFIWAERLVVSRLYSSSNTC